MFYGNTVEETRQIFFSSWNKYLQQLPLSPLEDEIAQVILAHPEYHSLLEKRTQFEHQAYFPELGETNPFLHLGLHLAVREQISTDRPQGIYALAQQLLQKHRDTLTVEHLMMEKLAEALWLAQKNNQPPDEQAYLISLNDL